MKKFFSMVLISVACATPLQAKSLLPVGCGLKEQVNITVNFNTQVQSFAEAKSKFDAKMQQLKETAKQQNLQKFDLLSMNYSVSPGGYNENKTYQMNGSISFQLESVETASAFAELLEKQKFNVSLTSNAYRQGNCQD